jgi:hypothetical protein
VLPRPEDSLDLDEHALHNLDWDSIIKELGLHDDPGPALKTLHQLNTCEPQVHHHLPELPHSQPSFDATQFVHSAATRLPSPSLPEPRL